MKISVSHKKRQVLTMTQKICGTKMHKSKTQVNDGQQLALYQEDSPGICIRQPASCGAYSKKRGCAVQHIPVCYIGFLLY